MNVKFCLAFPREAVSVPVVRRVLGDTLRDLGVDDECIGDILVAVTEACTNVLRHSGATRRYEVVTSLGPSGCLVEVVDSGQGFGSRAAAAAAQTDGRRDGPAARSRRAPRTQDQVVARNSARAKDPVSGQERATKRRGALATAGRPCSRAPRRPDDQVIASLPESGRGLQIMRAMVDDVTLQSGPGKGTVVSMRKRVSWRNGAPLAALSDRKLRDAG